MLPFRAWIGVGPGDEFAGLAGFNTLSHLGKSVSICNFPGLRPRRLVYLSVRVPPPRPSAAPAATPHDTGEIRRRRKAILRAASRTFTLYESVGPFRSGAIPTGAESLPHGTQEASMKRFVGLCAVFTLALWLSPAAHPQAQANQVIPGTQVRLTLMNGLSSNVAHTGDPFTAVVAEPVFAGNTMILPAGAVIHGTVTTVEI